MKGWKKKSLNLWVGNVLYEVFVFAPWGKLVRAQGDGRSSSVAHVYYLYITWGSTGYHQKEPMSKRMQWGCLVQGQPGKQSFKDIPKLSVVIVTQNIYSTPFQFKRHTHLWASMGYLTSCCGGNGRKHESRSKGAHELPKRTDKAHIPALYNTQLV